MTVMRARQVTQALNLSEEEGWALESAAALSGSRVVFALEGMSSEGQQALGVLSRAAEFMGPEGWAAIRDIAIAEEGKFPF